MYCSKCGNQIADGSRFCSFCGSPVAEVQSVAPEMETPVTQPEPKAEIKPETDAVRRPFIEDINWNVNEYPTTDTVEKTEDIDFDWGADPEEIRERLTREYPEAVKAEIREKADELNVEDLIPSKPARPEVPPVADPADDISAADKIDKFYTFSRKNEEFQQLLNREYDKIKGGNPIEQEKAIADKAASERFEAGANDPSMEAFLSREGVNKPYEPKAFESDVLQRIEAHERELEQARAEEEARQKMIEEERAKAAAEMRAAEEARIRAEEEERERLAEEARARVVEEVRRAEEAAKLAAEEAARAEEEATRLEAEAAAKLAAEEEARRQEEARIAREAVEEARRKNEERARAEAEAKAKAEEEARIKAEEEARAKAEEEARLAAEEEARRREAEEKARIAAEEELRAKQQAEKIRAQQEARQAATEKEKRIAEIERRRQEEEELRNSLSRKQENLRLQAESAAAAEEARKVLAQTAKMREEEAAKIKAAIAGLKGEPVKEAAPVPEPVAAPVAEPVIDHAKEPTIKITPDMFKSAIEAAAEPSIDHTIVAKPKAQPPQVEKPAPAEKPVQTAPSAEEAAKLDAHKATQADLSKMAKARAQFLAEFGIDPISGKAPEEPAPKKQEEIPATVEELLGEKPVTSRDTMFSQINDNIHTKTVNKDDVIRGLENTRRISKDELKAVEVISAEELEAEQLKSIDEIAHTKTVEEMLEEMSAPAAATELGAVMFDAPDTATPEAAADVIDDQIENADVSAGETAAPELEELVAVEPEPPVVEGLVAKEEPTVSPDTIATEGLKPGLNDTMVMTGEEIKSEAKGADDSFADYGEKEAEALRKQQESAAAETVEAVVEEVPEVQAEEPVAVEPEPAAESAPEVQAEAPAAAQVAEAEANVKEKGGAGRTILKVLLIILIIIFVIELAGIGIKWLAPDSGAAEFIDNQLNKVIHLITGSAPDYQIPGIDYEV